MYSKKANKLYQLMSLDIETSLSPWAIRDFSSRRLTSSINSWAWTIKHQSPWTVKDFSSRRPTCSINSWAWTFKHHGVSEQSGISHQEGQQALSTHEPGHLNIILYSTTLLLQPGLYHQEGHIYSTISGVWTFNRVAEHSELNKLMILDV